jgi:hypothetical protein
MVGSRHNAKEFALRGEDFVVVVVGSCVLRSNKISIALGIRQLSNDR